MTTPRTRATAAPARRTHTARAIPPPPVEEPEVVEATAADAQEADADEGHYVTAALCGEPIRVIPPSAWRLSWNRQLRNEDLDGLFGHVIHPDDLEFVLDELDPTNDEIIGFLQDAGAISGEPLGKSSGPRRSSRASRRR